MRYNRPKYMARCILKSPLLSNATVCENKRIIERECECLCKKLSPSYLRVADIKNLCEFKWDVLIKHLQDIAPVLTTILSAATGQSKETKPNVVAICVVASLLLKQRCKHVQSTDDCVSSTLCWACSQTSELIIFLIWLSK